MKIPKEKSFEKSELLKNLNDEIIDLIDDRGGC